MTLRSRWVAAACVAAAVGASTLRLAYWLPRDDDLETVVLSLGQLAVVLGAFLVIARRPGSRVGPLLLVWGLYTVVGGVGADRSHALFVLWFSLQPLYWILLAHALLTYPDGRTRDRAERWFLAIAYAVPLLWLAIGLGAPLWRVNAVLGTTLGVAFLALLARRYRAATPARRRATRPVVWGTALLAVAFVARTSQDSPTAQWATWIATFGVPAALLIGLLTSKLARAEVATLLLKLRTAPPDDLAEALGELLRDPTVHIVRTRPAPNDTQAVTPLSEDRYLVHHPHTRDEDPELFDAGVAAVRMMLDNHRLSERLVRAADDERRRVERDLHDGAQQRLLGLGMALRSARRTVPDGTDTAELLDDAAGQLRASLAELRTLARGLRPALLTERGLPAALADLRRRVPLAITLDVDVPERPSAQAETTAYFVVAEALQNVARHAPAASVHIGVRRDGDRLCVEVSDDGPGGADPAEGSGLRGLADRVAAVGGRLTITSAGGTTVAADLPADAAS